MKLDLSVKIKVYLTLSYIVLFLINAFFPSITFVFLMAPIAVVMIILAFPHITKSNKYLSIVLFILGILLLFNQNADLKSWMEALSKNSGITILLLCLPILKIILSYEDFETPITNFTRKYSNTPSKFYISATLITIFLGALINVACIHLVHELLEKPMKTYPEKLFYQAATRAFTSNMFWSPNNVSVAIVIQTLALPWLAIAPYGLLIALIANVLSILMVKISYRSWVIEPITDNDNKADARIEYIDNKQNGSEKGLKDTLRVLSLILLLIFLVAFLSTAAKKSILVVVPLLSFIFPAFIALIFKKTNIFKIKFKEYLDTSLPGLNDEIVLFTSIAFFGYALGISDIIKFIPQVIQQLGFSNPISLLSFIIFLITSLAMLGLHPIITISAIATAYTKGGMPVSTIQMAFALMAGYTFYTILSPFSGLALVTSSLGKKNPFSVSLKLNFIYSLILAILLILLLSFF